MKRLLARIGHRLGRLQSDSGEARPDYGDERLFALLAASPAARRAPGLALALDAFGRGARAKAAGLTVRHFASRPAPHFFADPATLHNSSEHPVLAQSLRGATEAALDMTTRGLPVCGRLAPPLRAGFPWHDALGLRSDDVLFAVRPHRFGFLPQLALATAIGSHPRAELIALIDDWTHFAQRDPVLPFCSNLVVIQRLLATAWAFAFMGITSGELEVRWRLFKIIGQDVLFLLPRLGDSYPNNHLLLDRFAAWFIALLLPEILPGDTDLADREGAWIAELERQTYDDGGSIEHSTHYHGLAAEMGAAYLLLADANTYAVPARIRARIARMLRLQSALCGPDGRAVQIGDSSDDPLFPLDDSVGGNAAALREIERGLFEPDRASIANGHPARIRAWWLLGGKLAANACEPVMTSTIILGKGGLVVFSEDDEETRCTLRLGPMAGTHYLPGHQHADALSVTLTRRGTPLLVEAGTCTYRFREPRGNPRRVNWRAYFAGADAHNGLVVRGRDPYGRMRGDFRPKGRLPEVSSTRFAAGRHLAFHEASLHAHERYPGWARGVVHLRGVALIVYDRLDAVAVRLPMHFAFQWAPECELVRLDNAGVTARVAGVGVHLAWSRGLGQAEIICGREHPTNGWVSPSYGECVAAPQLLVPVTTESVLTAFALIGEERTRILAVQCEMPSARVCVFQLVTDVGLELVLLNLGAPTETIETQGITFEGRIAWIRIPSAGQPSVRWLDGRLCVANQWAIQYALPATVAEFAD